MRSLIFLIICLLFLASCDEAPQLSSLSKIATSFDTGSTSYPGGVIIVGERQDGPGTVSYSFTTSQNSVQLEKGDWVFYAVAYAGPDKFDGAKSCAMTSASFRKGKSTSLSLNLSNDNCSGKLARTLKLRTVFTKPCGVLTNYSSGNDKYLAPDELLPGTYCKNPAEQDDRLGYYRFFSLNVIDGNETPGFSSQCIPTGLVAPGLELPTEKMPLGVKFYKSSYECNADAVPHVSYNFSSGIGANYSSSFDKFTKELSVLSYQLYLPSAHTRRMKSPFMGMIPRILCGSPGSYTDCAPEPYQSIYAKVPWDFKVHDQLLMKNVTSQDCHNLEVKSKLFSIDNCQVRNRSMYGTIRRNALTCMETSVYGANSVVDLYERNHKFYILYRSGTDSKIGVYSDSGQLDQVFTVAPNLTYTSLAATDTGVIYAMAPAQILKFTKNTSGLYTQSGIIAISNGSLIEVTPDGHHLFLAKNSANTFEVYQTSNFVLRSTTGYSLPVNQLQFYKGILYSGHDTTNAGNPAGIIYRSAFNPQTAEVTTNPVDIGFENDINRFYITSDDRYFILHNSGIFYEYSIEPSTGAVTIIHGSGGGVTMTNVRSFVATRNVYFLSDGTNFKAYNVNTGGVWSLGGDYDGTCEEDVVLTEGTHSQMISVQSFFAPPSTDRNFHLFEAGMKFAGRRTPLSDEANEFLFPHLNEEQTKSTLGGGLNRIQRILGPHGVGGLFSDFATCSDLMTVLSVSELNRTMSVDDPYTGFRTYNVRALAATSSLPAFFCNDSDPVGTCNNDVGLRLKVTSTGLFEKENYVLRLKCDNKVGGLDYLKYDSEEKRKEYIFWNTNDHAQARYETVKTHKLNGLFKAEVIKASKTDQDGLWGRGIAIEKSSDLIKSKAIEYQRDDTNHFATFLEIQDTPEGYLVNTDYVSDGSSNDFSGSTALCLSNTGTNMGAASMAGCSITNQYTSTSFGLSLSLDELNDADDETGSFQSIFSVEP